ncbi:DoxX family protein [Flavobacterium hibernum]|uniref:DoxX family membrane protein n=1 Tax=Flavobacterium hibernum TaxID=37752 RepID=A0A0D0EEH1_9FLAO|nr:DoxX family protein [Flavobacterium hibernum]KIO52344.1 DoxX family protein [Flavobacterium hibernum]OXA87191.1 DoxX family membrane protein [Flavobacterium hibernum]PTS92885.1 DoxX family protein [Flavobacterium sp. HMWF030]STO14241.1 DoxX [Flavobacterium hibernum]
MINLFETKRNENYLSIVILVIRISIAGLMISHGLSKLNMLFAGGEIDFPDPIGVGKTASLTLAVFAEVVCSFLLFIGLATRLATLPLIITMLVAVFIIHGADPIDVKEMGILYLLFYILLLVTGSGKFSIDYLISKKNRY